MKGASTGAALPSDTVTITLYGDPAKAPVSTVPVIDRLNSSTQRAKIHEAARSDDYTEVEKLLKDGADPNVVDGSKGRTAMHYASITGDPDMVDLLAKSDANINAVE